MKEEFTSTKSPWNYSRSLRKMLILAALIGCTFFVAWERPVEASASIDCYEAQTDFTNAMWSYEGSWITYSTCTTNCQSAANAYYAAELALFSASSGLAGTCQMEQPEFCSGAYGRAAQCEYDWGWYMSIEDPEYNAYVYNQYMACMSASGYYSCV